ncbi:MAG: hypothetical protein M1838_004470 [Thelocarpon superellum]|nr:MAG: hypothetical protein M1838_004470 [Thelocarpon superellum]
MDAPLRLRNSHAVPVMVTSRASGSSSPSQSSSDDAWAEELSWLNSAAATLKSPPSIDRITEHENARSPRPSRPSQGPAFQVTGRSTTELDEASSLARFPNEVLTHLLSHLPPSSLATVALVSRQFYGLVTTPHAWRIAFARFFPGPDAMHAAVGLQDSDRRMFSRLTRLASWRSEYVLRTRLMRSLARGKPLQGSAPSAGRSPTSSRAGAHHPLSQATVTYNTQLLTTVTHMHSTFGTGASKRLPRFIHGADEMGAACSSDPRAGKVDQWGFSDPQSFLQFADRFPGDAQWGLGAGEVVGVPNVMDVSQPYGVVYGEGSPGGLIYFRGADELRGRFLPASTTDAAPEMGIPHVPGATESICALWMAKSSTIVHVTNGLIGIMAGSSQGIISAYSMGTDGLGDQRLSRGEVTARWAVSPGVPIVAIVVDELSSAARAARGQIWAVALNALGEVFCLTGRPRRPASARATKLDTVGADRMAWTTGRSVSWSLLGPTRRIPRVDPFDTSTHDGTLAPRSSSDAMALSTAQLAQETREVEAFLRHPPKHFRRVCEGWDMRRKLAVDFAGLDGEGMGQSIIVVSSDAEDKAAGVKRWTSCATAATTTREWHLTHFDLGGAAEEKVTVTAMDESKFAALAAFEDPVLDASDPATPSSRLFEVPGHRARFFAVGTASGTVIVWDVRAPTSRAATLDNVVLPLRVIQTESPQISSLALTSLYVVHGGNDGLVQAWDPLASSLQPIRTLHSRFSSRARRRLIQAEASAQGTGINLFAAGAICLDPDPCVLRGVVSLGTHLRYWSYSSSAVDQYSGRKRRLRRSERGSNGMSDRFSGTGRGALHDYIANEKLELEREKERKRRDADHLAGRFGVGLLGHGESEEELLAYARLLSEEAYAQEEEKRKSESDGHRSESHDTRSSDPVSALGMSSPHAGAEAVDADVAEAIRLSLMEEEVERVRGGSARGSPVDYPIRYVTRRRTSSSSPRHGVSGQEARMTAVDEDLDLALQLSLAEETSRKEVAGKGKRRAS